MAYTKFMITCMLHFRESYPESCPRIIPANHTSETYLRISKGGRNIPRNIPPNHTSETYLESYPLMQHALLGTEFSEKAIYIYTYLITRQASGRVSVTCIPDLLPRCHLCQGRTPRREVKGAFLDLLISLVNQV